MKFSCSREAFLKPLQVVQGVVERRQALPILANVLLRCDEGSLMATATDMELELSVGVSMPDCEAGETTVPARKLLDICRSLPAEAPIEFRLERDRVQLRSGRSRFQLSTLPVKDYPSSDGLSGEARLSLTQGELKQLLELTHFAMAHQDVRYYLNGLLLEMGRRGLRAVATDGHRLAVAEMELEGAAEVDRSIILPRKGVMELMRLLSGGDEPVSLSMSSSAVQVELGDTRLTSKLIDGRFPDYERVIPREEQCDKRFSVDRETLRQSLQRVAILSNDKYRAVRVVLGEGTLRLLATNPDQEQAEEEMEVAYDGEPLEIGFNVSYLIDALVNLPSANAHLFMTDSSSSCLIRGDEAGLCEYVVMPMRL